MEGSYGGPGGADQQRPYHGRAGQPPVARRPPAGQNGDFRDGHGYAANGVPGYDRNSGPGGGSGQYSDPRYGQGRPPPGDYGHPRAHAPMRGGHPHPGGRGGGPPMMGRPANSEVYSEGYRGPHPGAMGPMQGRGGMPRGGGAPQGPLPHRSNTQFTVAGAGRPPNGAPMPQRGPGPVPGRGGHSASQLAHHMAAMDINAAAPPGPPHGAGGPDGRRGLGHPGGPPHRDVQPHGYPDAGQTFHGEAIGNDFGGELQDEYGYLGPALEFGGPQRSMTMPANGGFAGHGLPAPDRPATTTGDRPIPQRTYPSGQQDPTSQGHAGTVNYSVDYGHMGQIDDFYGSYYAEEELDYAHHEEAPSFNPSRSSMPDFDAIPTHDRRDSFEASMVPGGAQQAPQLGHAKSMAELRQPQPLASDLPADVPHVPGLPPMATFQHQPAGFDAAVPQRQPSAPPGPMAQPGYANPPMARPATTAPPLENLNADALPAHPTPVRPGLLQNSVVNPSVKPPPVRNYGGLQQPGLPIQQQQQPQPQQQHPYPQQQQQQQQQQYLPAQGAAGRPRSRQQEGEDQAPVTSKELEHLRMIVKNDPNDQAAALRLAKRLLVAANTLVANIPDPRARARVRGQMLGDAQKTLRRLASAQNQEAMFVLADSFGKGVFGGEPDHKEAFSMYQSAAKLGHAGAAYRTAVCCEVGHEEGGGTRKDPLKAIMWYKRAATLGDPPGMYKIGMILLKGLLGQPKNPREAVGWLKRAAEQADEENPHALHELGLLYESAQGNDVIIRDEQYALTLFQQAAELGYKFSQFKLGCVYEYGLLGCPIDARLSIVWYSRAAAQEEHQSELALSGWYLTGSEGVLAQSDMEAYLWARKAAIAGLAKAEYAMGYFTEVGIGVAANLEDAKRWYWRAASQDYPKARDRLEDLKKAGKDGKPPRERISRSQPQEGECVLM